MGLIVAYAQLLRLKVDADESSEKLKTNTKVRSPFVKSLISRLNLFAPKREQKNQN